MLETLHFIRDTGVPVLGVKNTGRLGFLASVYKEDYTSAIDKLIQKQFTIDARALLQLQNQTICLSLILRLMSVR